MRQKRAGKEKKTANAVTAVSDYLNNLQAFPQLKHPEVVELFQRYEAGGRAAEKARSRLIECNLRLVVSIAKQYKSHNIPIEDLIQEGNIGLMKAVERFKWDKGFKFSTYATWWIKQAIGQHVMKRKRIIRLPAHAVAVQRKLLQAADEYRELMGCEPTQEELIKLIGASSTVVKATMHGGRSVISLQQPISSSDDDSDSIEDKIEDHDILANPFEAVAQGELLEIAKRVISELTPKEAAIIRLRFGLVDEDMEGRYPITEQELQHVMQGKSLV